MKGRAGSERKNKQPPAKTKEFGLIERGRVVVEKKKNHFALDDQKRGPAAQLRVHLSTKGQKIKVGPGRGERRTASNEFGQARPENHARACGSSSGKIVKRPGMGDRRGQKEKRKRGTQACSSPTTAGE